jgi:hypothetical protein
MARADHQRALRPWRKTARMLPSLRSRRDFHIDADVIIETISKFRKPAEYGS